MSSLGWFRVESPLIQEQPRIDGTTGDDPPHVCVVPDNTDMGADAAIP